jgi:probable O-glycosylation ligase (exosortase A-associated)
MLRLLFIGTIVAFGTFYAAISPFYALLFYLWHAYFRPEEWVWWVNLVQFHISLIIGTYLVFRTMFSGPNPRIGVRTLMLFLFLAQSTIGTVTSEHPAYSLMFLEDFTKVLLISYIIVVLVTDRDRFRLTLVVIALSLGFECAKQGWAGLILAPGAKNDNSIGFLGDNNGVAVGTMMLVPILGALASTATRRWEKFGYRFLAVGVFLRGISTYSRGGFISAAVLGLFVFMRSQRKVRALLGIAAIVVLVWQMMPQEYWSRINSITTNEEEMDRSEAGRVHFWRVAIDMARAKPLTGVGLNVYQLSFQRYNTDSRYDGQRSVHSAWFGVLAELGLPGLMLFLANFFTAFFSCWSVARLTKGNPAARNLNLFANAMITSFAVWAAGTSFLAGQYDEMMWHFVGLSTALFLIATEEARAAQPVIPAVRPQWEAVGLGSAVGTTFGALREPPRRIQRP